VLVVLVITTLVPPIVCVEGELAVVAVHIVPVNVSPTERVKLQVGVVGKGKVDVPAVVGVPLAVNTIV
jgi:hypothetical protein